MLLTTGICAAVAYEKEIKNLSTALSENIQKAGKKSVAVADFTDLQGNITELGRFIAEELSVDLTNNSQGFEIADRAHLKTLLAEHKLSVSGLVDPNTVKKLGQIAGVDAIVLGTFTPFGDSIRLSCKVIATDTAKVIGATKGDIAKTSAIEELLGKGIGSETGSNTSGQVKPERIKVPALAHHIEQVENVKVELTGCGISGSTVTCSMLLTNLDKDKKFYILAQNSPPATGQGQITGPRFTRIYNDTGEEYRLAKVKIANHEDSWRVESLLVQNVPVKSFVSFQNVSSETNFISLLDICVNIGEYPQTQYVVQFRNIPVTRTNTTKFPLGKGKKR